MRKELMSVLLMSQALEGFAMNGSIVSLGAMNAEAQRFHQSVNMAIREVRAGRSTTDNAIAVVGGTYQNQLSTLRTQINQRFFDQVRDQELQQEQQTQNLISTRQREISVLQARLSRASGNKGNLHLFEPELRRAEQNVRMARSRAEQTGAPELVTGRQMDRTIERFIKQLNKIKEQIQSGQKTLEEAFERTQERYGDSIESLIGELQDRYEDIVANLNSQHEDERSHLEEAYEQQKTVLERMLAEVNGLNAKLEEEKQLHSYVNRIFVANPSLEPKKIIARAGDIERINDILVRHDTLEGLYEKFKLFTELYGNTELGVCAMPRDLRVLGIYVSQIKTMQRPIAIVGFQEIGGSNWWGEPNVNWGEYQRIIRIVPSAAQRYVYPNCGRASFGGGRVDHCDWKDWNGRVRFISTANSEIARINRENQEKYEADINRAKSVVFPSESFNRLVDQFNEFINRL